MVADGACSGTVKKPFGSDGIHSDVAEVLPGRPGANIGCEASGRVLGSGWPTQGPAGRGVGMLYRHIASFAIE